MAFCGNCGTKVEEGIKFCPDCGAPMQAQAEPQSNPVPQQANIQNTPINLNNTADTTEGFSQQDIEANKIMSVLAYIIFLIPLLVAKESPYAKFHTNQGLVLFLAAIVVSLVGGIIPILGWFLILPVGCIIVAVLGVIGIINAFTGKAKELPIIGKIKILK